MTELGQDESLKWLNECCLLLAAAGARTVFMFMYTLAYFFFHLHAGFVCRNKQPLAPSSHVVDTA